MHAFSTNLVTVPRTKPVELGMDIREALINIAATLKWQFHKHRDMLAEITTPAQHKAIAAFVQAPGDYFDAEPTFKQSYAPQSGYATRREM